MAAANARKEALTGFEPPEITVQYSATSSPVRMILNPVEIWTDEERQNFEAFKKYCSEERGGIPGKVDDCFRFLQAKGFNIEAAYELLIART